MGFVMTPAMKGRGVPAMCNSEFPAPRSHMFVSSDNVRHLIKASGGHCEYFMSLMLFSGASRSCALHITANISVYQTDVVFRHIRDVRSVSKMLIAQNIKLIKAP